MRWRAVADDCSEIWGAVSVRRKRTAPDAAAAASGSAQPASQPNLPRLPSHLAAEAGGSSDLPRQLASLLQRQREHLRRLHLDMGAGDVSDGAAALALAAACGQGSGLTDVALALPNGLPAAVLEALPGAASQLTALIFKPLSGGAAGGGGGGPRSDSFQWRHLSSLSQLQALSLAADFQQAGDPAAGLAALSRLTRLRLHGMAGRGTIYTQGMQEVAHVLLACTTRLARLELVALQVEELQRHWQPAPQAAPGAAAPGPGPEAAPGAAAAAGPQAAPGAAAAGQGRRWRARGARGGGGGPGAAAGLAAAGPEAAGNAPGLAGGAAMGGGGGGQNAADVPQIGQAPAAAGPALVAAGEAQGEGPPDAADGSRSASASTAASGLGSASAWQSDEESEGEAAAEEAPVADGQAPDEIGFEVVQQQQWAGAWPGQQNAAWGDVPGGAQPAASLAQLLAPRWCHLEALRLQDCQLSREVLEVLPTLPALTSLHLAPRRCYMHAVDIAQQCSHLQELVLVRYLDYHLPHLPRGALSQLTRLRISGSEELMKLHASWCNLPNLLSFEMESCEQLLHLPLELSTLTQLQRITFSHQRMEVLPWQLTGLSQLTRLAVAACSLGELPAGPYLMGLRELVLFANSLSCVPPALVDREWGAFGLRRLDLGSNYSHSLSDADVVVLRQLTCLTLLDLRRQQYSSTDAHPEQLLQELQAALPRCDILA